MHTLLLDSKIRDWVLFPIFIACILVGLCCHFAMVLLTNPVILTDSEREVLRQKSILTRAARLRLNGSILTSARFNAKRASFCKIEIPQSMPSIPQTSIHMDNTVKMLLTTEFPRVVMSAIVGYFFNGYIICRGRCSLSEQTTNAKSPLFPFKWVPRHTPTECRTI